MQDQSNLKVNKGDKIAVKARGMTVRGTVYSAAHWGASGWYIEITDANVPGGFSYWKQGEDGGEVIEINGESTVELRLCKHCGEKLEPGSYNWRAFRHVAGCP